MIERHYSTNSPGDTTQLGKDVGRRLFPGAVIALDGPLGAGKTFLTQGIALGLEIAEPGQVTSPTFVLIQEYEARLPIYHFDAYRLKHLQEFEDLGALEYLAGEGVCIIEWAEKIAPLLPKEFLHIRIEATGTHTRQLTLTAQGEQYEMLLQAIGS